MAYALRGSAGTYVTGTAPQSPAFSASTLANNLLVCWAACVSGTPHAITTPSGWSLAVNLLSDTSYAMYIFYKIAAGGDAAPSVTGTGITVGTQVAEFSGGATSSPLDQTGSNAGAGTASTVATAGSTDAASGELLIYLGLGTYSTTAVRTTTNALNNGATATTAHSDSGGSLLTFTDFGYGITTGHSAADTYTYTLSTTSKELGNRALLASFKLAGGSPVVVVPGRTLMGAGT